MEENNQNKIHNNHSVILSICLQIFLIVVIFMSGEIMINNGHFCSILASCPTDSRINLFAFVILGLVVLSSIIYSLVKIKERSKILLFSLIITPGLIYFYHINFQAEQGQHDIDNRYKEANCLKEGKSPEECMRLFH